MKRYLKMILVLVVALSILCTIAMATSDPFKSAYDNATKAGDGAEISTHINKFGGTAITTVQTIGYIVAVVMVLYVGIQWLIGTPAKKQELKGRMVSLVVGAVLVAGGVTILGWISDIATKDLGINKTSQVVVERV
jgi:hypothetical protein